MQDRIQQSTRQVVRRIFSICCCASIAMHSSAYAQVHGGIVVSPSGGIEAELNEINICGDFGESTRGFHCELGPSRGRTGNAARPPSSGTDPDTHHGEQDAFFIHLLLSEIELWASRLDAPGIIEHEVILPDRIVRFFEIYKGGHLYVISDFSSASDVFGMQVSSELDIYGLGFISDRASDFIGAMSSGKYQYNLSGIGPGSPVDDIFNYDFITVTGAAIPGAYGGGGDEVVLSPQELGPSTLAQSTSDFWGSVQTGLDMAVGELGIAVTIAAVAGVSVAGVGIGTVFIAGYAFGRQFEDELDFIGPAIAADMEEATCAHCENAWAYPYEVTVQNEEGEEVAITITVDWGDDDESTSSTADDSDDQMPSDPDVDADMIPGWVWDILSLPGVKRYSRITGVTISDEGRLDPLILPVLGHENGASPPAIDPDSASSGGDGPDPFPDYEGGASGSGTIDQPPDGTVDPIDASNGPEQPSGSMSGGRGSGGFCIQRFLIVSPSGRIYSYCADEGKESIAAATGDVTASYRDGMGIIVEPARGLSGSGSSDGESVNIGFENIRESRPTQFRATAPNIADTPVRVGPRRLSRDPD